MRHLSWDWRASGEGLLFSLQGVLVPPTVTVVVDTWGGMEEGGGERSSHDPGVHHRVFYGNELPEL